MSRVTLVVSPLHILSFYFPPPLLPSLNLSSSVRVRLTIISRKARAHFGQNQLTQKSLYNPRSYEPCKCRLKNDVCGAALLLGFPKYSGQIVFARHCERHYPSFWMSSVIGIIGAKVQKLTLRVIALQVGLSDEIRGWVCTVCQCSGVCLVNTTWLSVCIEIDFELRVFTP